ncbi:MAG: hypothetical protein AB1630_03190 [bacterium]
MEKALSGAKVIAVLDRATGLNASFAPLCLEIRSSLYGLPEAPLLVNYIYGLGGRDIGIEDIKRVYNDLTSCLKEQKVDEPIRYLGVRE